MHKRLLLLASLFLLLTPAASARHDDLPLGIGEYHVELPDRDCLDCASVSLAASWHQAKPCTDCASLEAWVEVTADDEGVHMDAVLCRGGFFYFCLLDEHRTL